MRLIFFFTILSYSINALGQDTTLTYPKEKFFNRIRNDGLIAGKVIVEVYKRPLYWEKKHWLLAGGALAVSAASTLLDEPISDYYSVNSGKNRFISNIAKMGDAMGQPEYNYPFMLTLWGLGVVTNNDWLRDTGIIVIASVTTSGLVQTALKTAVGRARPMTDEGPYSFKPFTKEAGYHSFPSGHTMLALATAYVLAHRIDFMPLRIIVFAVPVITGFSRIHDRAHFFSDIVLGSAIGIGFAEAVLQLYPSIKEKYRSRISFMPTGNGLLLTYTF